jgi:hypothetical protein
MTALFNARGIALDPHGNIFVTDSEANAIIEYAATATANAVPLSTISGPSTAVSQPTGIALDKDGNIYVTNHAGGLFGVNASVTEYPSGSNERGGRDSSALAPLVACVPCDDRTLGWLLRRRRVGGCLGSSRRGTQTESGRNACIQRAPVSDLAWSGRHSRLSRRYTNLRNPIIQVICRPISG